MKLFRLKVSGLRSSKDRKKYPLAHYGKDENEVMAEFGINHPYLKVYSIKEVYMY
ncbi:hypothetical protein BFINDDAI_00073 [Salmonella phage EH2]|nr:hypothetical protein BFINDDAI_00073 [Salmonella phage EH2]WMT11314.1 hypothetical protein BFINDDAO_00073 [Salmonella phage EH5]